MKYLYVIYRRYNIEVITLVRYATIETKLQSAKNLPKTPWQKLPKNPLKIPQAKIQQWMTKIFYDFLNKKTAKKLK